MGVTASYQGSAPGRENSSQHRETIESDDIVVEN